MQIRSITAVAVAVAMASFSPVTITAASAETPAACATTQSLPNARWSYQVREEGGGDPYVELRGPLRQAGVSANYFADAFLVTPGRTVTCVAFNPAGKENLDHSYVYGTLPPSELQLDDVKVCDKDGATPENGGQFAC